MSERRAPESMASQIIDEAKRMAVTFQIKEFTDKAARELKKPVRQVKCKFCFEEHHTSDCSNIPQDEKMALWKKPRISSRIHMQQSRNSELKHRIRNPTGRH